MCDSARRGVAVPARGHDRAVPELPTRPAEPVRVGLTRTARRPGRSAFTLTHEPLGIARATERHAASIDDKTCGPRPGSSGP